MSTTIDLTVTPARAELFANDEPQMVYLHVLGDTAATRGSGNTGVYTNQPLNICLAIDRSSSMRGERLYQVKEAARHLVNALGPDDAFALVTFNDRAEVVVPASKGADPSVLQQAISSIEARGGTEMAQGLGLALQEISRKEVAGLHRLILLTDGRTYGDEQPCVELARKAQQRGIGLTALGVGTEWNEDLLETITSGESSRTQYITSVGEIVPVFQAELQRLRDTVAQRAELTVNAPASTQLRACHRTEPFIAPLTWETLDEGQWRIPLGEWPAKGEQHFLVELVLAPCVPGQQQVAQCELRYELLGSSEALHSAASVEAMAWPWPDMAVDPVVRASLERLTAYRLQARAWQAVNEGRIEEATRRLQQAGTHLYNAGQVKLAAAVNAEATYLLKSGTTSSDGRKRIKYGTRGLLPGQTIP